MSKRPHEELGKYYIRCWNAEDEDSSSFKEEDNVEEEETVEVEEMEEEEDSDGDYKVSDPECADEEGFYEDVTDFTSLIVDYAQQALAHETNGTIMHEYPYTYDMCYLAILEPSQKMRKMDAVQDDCPLDYRYMRKQEDWKMIELEKSSEAWIADILSNYEKDIQKKKVFDVSCLDVSSIRVRNNKTKIVRIMSPREMVNAIVADPPLLFSYSIGFLGEKVSQ